MSLTAGKRIGPYEIVGPLGTGGMGEVYRARDTRLGRDVAIKILPTAIANEPTRLRRFEQEARTTGMLNHPNILAVFDVGQHEGLPYLVTELLEGATLRDAFPVSRRAAIDYARQIAVGLAAAHAKGVTHRDLKPENVFVTKDGRVKILDFGLAKVEVSTSDDDMTRSAATTPGAVLGTVGYMSPEQARGQTADHRSDIFSFGAILHEMVSGQRAFHRDSSVETMHAIIKDDPAPLSDLALERIARRCLEKSPELRFQSASDLAFALESESAARSGISAIAAEVPLTANVAHPRSTNRPRLALAAAILIAALGGVLAGRAFFRTPTPTFQRLTFRRGYVFSARFTRDGHSVIYGASWDGDPLKMFQTRLDTPGSQPLDLPDADILAVSSTGELAISPGRNLQGGEMPQGSLARAPLMGGAPRISLEDVMYADWSPDGASLAIVRQSGGKTRLEFPVGKVLYETAGWLSYPRVSPRGDRVAFLDHPALGDDRGRLAVVDLTGKKTTLSEEYGTAQGVAWLASKSPSKFASGDEVWMTGAHPGQYLCLLRAYTMSGKVRDVFRVPMRLRLHDISREGQALISFEEENNGLQGWSPREQKERDFSWQATSSPSDISADGALIAFNEYAESLDYAVYTRKTDGAPPVRIGDGAAPALSPDGKWALVILPTPPKQLVLLPTGPGESRRLSREGFETIQSADWFPDGKRIVVYANETGRSARLFQMDIQNGQRQPLTPEGTRGVLHPVSPDGKWVAAQNPDGGMVLYSTEGQPPRTLAGLAPDEVPIRWASDGKSLFILRRGRLPAHVERMDLASGKRTAWKELMPSDRAGVRSIGWNTVQIAGGGNGYAYSYQRNLGYLALMDEVK
jgi:eukaryotic-like serine/threonine-protein kinase